MDDFRLVRWLVGEWVDGVAAATRTGPTVGQVVSVKSTQRIHTRTPPAKKKASTADDTSVRRVTSRLDYYTGMDFHQIGRAGCGVAGEDVYSGQALAVLLRCR